MPPPLCPCAAPLYEIVDCVFQLQTRGFFRRQVFSVARQVLSLVAGDAIDVYLLSRLRLLRQEHTIARVVQSIQVCALCAGGVGGAVLGCLCGPVGSWAAKVWASGPAAAAGW